MLPLLLPCCRNARWSLYDPAPPLCRCFYCRLAALLLPCCHPAAATVLFQWGCCAPLVLSLWFAVLTYVLPVLFTFLSFLRLAPMSACMSFVAVVLPYAQLFIACSMLFNWAETCVLGFFVGPGAHDKICWTTCIGGFRLSRFWLLLLGLPRPVRARKSTTPQIF